jgi:uncharacterized membrane-anchored protein
MQKLHNPQIDLRYWILISLASIFGTNTGDLTVRLFNLTGQSWFGLKHLGPLPLLILAFAAVYLIEKKDQRSGEAYFWTAIILIRTAATQIADTVNGDLGVDLIFLIGGLAFVLVVLALQWQSKRTKPLDLVLVPDTTQMYWLTMLIAGVLGTVIGDELWHIMGLASSSLVLSISMGILVFLGHKSFLKLTALYWFGVLFARIAGTAVGDWLAKTIARGGAGLTLEGATLLSGLVFIGVCYFWKWQQRDQDNR